MLGALKRYAGGLGSVGVCVCGVDGDAGQVQA